MPWAAHLQEERLLDCYLAERSGEPLDPPMADHLADCPECARRYADLAEFMDGLRSDAEAETEAVFTPHVRLAQQRQIARAIEQVGRHARVISFPDRAAGRHVNAATRGITPRWVAAAAAAGILLGVGLGASFRWERRTANQPLAVSAGPGAPASPPLETDGTRAVVTAAADDDAFLSDLEIALERPRTRELQAFDAITPHVREITNVQ